MGQGARDKKKKSKTKTLSVEWVRQTHEQTMSI